MHPSRWARIYTRFFGADSECISAAMVLTVLIKHRSFAVSLIYTWRRQPDLLNQVTQIAEPIDLSVSSKFVLRTCGVLQRRVHDRQTSRDVIDVGLCSINRCLREHARQPFHTYQRPRKEISTRSLGRLTCSMTSLAIANESDETCIFSGEGGGGVCKSNKR